MKKFKFNVKREAKITAVVLVIVAIIVFTERRQASRSIGDITIKMENVHENHFLEESDVASLMQLNAVAFRGLVQ